MKVNQNTAIFGEKVILIPYGEHHVQKYHNWMKNTEIQELTASEPLTIEEEYAMQESWALDSDKCTFIVLDKHTFKETNNEIESMIGDVNIFLTDPVNTELGEVEVMIADPLYRGQGRGKEALLSMMRYGIEQLGLTSIVAKIKMKNSVSFNIFRKLGFQETSKSEVFQEYTLTLNVSPEWIKDLKNQTHSYHIELYPFGSSEKL